MSKVLLKKHLKTSLNEVKNFVNRLVGELASTTSEAIEEIDANKANTSDVLTGGTQTSTSTADGGSNVFTFTKGDGSTATLTVRNGSKGSKGDKGDTGATGAKGDTPVKGTDYFTEADKAELVNDVLAALPNGDTEVYGA